MQRLDDRPAGMTQTHARGSVADRLAAAAAAALVGRAEERARLGALLAPDGPAAVFVHGPGGVGKTTLVTGTLAALPVTRVSLGGRHMEPTVPGALAALGAALVGVPRSHLGAVCTQVSYSCRMPKVLHIRNVPDDVHDALAEAAAAQGLSLTRYMLQELAHLAKRRQAVQSNAAVIRRTQAQVQGHPSRDTILSVLHEGRGN